MDPESSTAAGITLHLLGGFEVRRAGSAVRLETAKTNALLAYLALQDGPQPRHKLMGLFWGDLPEASARGNLRHALYQIRRALNDPERPPLVLATQQTITFNREVDYWLDVEAFERWLGREGALTQMGLPDNRPTLLHNALDLYQDDWLEGIYLDQAWRSKNGCSSSASVYADARSNCYSAWSSFPSAGANTRLVSNTPSA